MAITSLIEWTDATWNPWQGCTKVSEACDHCYMFTDLRRYGRDPTIVRRSADATFYLPLKRRRSGEHAIAPGSKVFTCSWSDWFHKKADGWRQDAWSIIQQRPDVTFQIVTKRTDRIGECLPPDWGDGWPNVWLIATVENQHWADVRVPQLLEVPAAVRGLSCEPLLGPLQLTGIRGNDSYFNAMRYGQLGKGITLDWVIAGGESGHHARPSHPDWIRSLRDQCQAADVPFFFKQWGEWLPSDEVPAGYADSYSSARRGSRNPCQTIGDVVMVRVGKKAAGRLLDGQEWNEFPEASLA